MNFYRKYLKEKLDHKLTENSSFKKIKLILLHIFIFLFLNIFANISNNNKALKKNENIQKAKHNKSGLDNKKVIYSADIQRKKDKD